MRTTTSKTIGILSNEKRQKCNEPNALQSPTSSERPTILFVGEAVSLAHVGRPLMLARWARQAGYKIAVACGPQMAERVRAENIEPILIETIAGQTFYERVHNGTFFYTPQELDAYVEAERALIKQVQPTLVVSDFRLTLAVSTALENVPLLSLCNAYWSPSYSGSFPGPNFGIHQFLPTWLRDAFFKLIKPHVFRSFSKPLDTLRRSHGLAPLNDLRAHYTAGRWCAYLDLASFIPVAPIPHDHFFLGPLAWTPPSFNHTNMNRIKKLGRERELVYLSAGSSGAGPWVPATLSCLKEKNVDVLVTGIDSKEAEAIRKEASFPTTRWGHAPLVDPGTVLNRAALTICHSGSGTVYQSLSHGVPVLCVPSNPDQQLVAQAVVTTGAGAQLDPCHLSHRSIKKTLKLLLDHSKQRDAYQHSAAQFESEMKRHQTESTWLNFLQREFPMKSKTFSSKLKFYG